MGRWRIAENQFNLDASPWRDAVLIEEDDDASHVPALVCAIYRGHSPEVAHLIAAAPDLLAALKSMIAGIEEYPGRELRRHVVDAASAAIARAEGETER